MNLREIVENTDSYWHYVGTATRPDLRCQENILWFIIKDVKEAADWQVEVIKYLFENNNSRKLKEIHPTLYHSSVILNCFLSLVSLLLI